MHLPRICSNNAICILILTLYGCASNDGLGVDSDARAKEIDLYGLRAPESWELVPEDFKMQWNNIQLQSACGYVMWKPESEVMAAWKPLLWSELTVDDSCVELLSAWKEGVRLANRAEDEGRSAELSKLCYQTYRRVHKLVAKRLEQGRLVSDIKEGVARMVACNKLTKE